MIAKPHVFDAFQFFCSQTARDDLQTCIEELVDLDTIKKEIDESKKTGSMDEVFGKYCKKRPEFKKCVDKFLEKLKLCLIDDERKNLETVLNLIKELGEFACYKDGDRIASEFEQKYSNRYICIPNVIVNCFFLAQRRKAKFRTY